MVFHHKVFSIKQLVDLIKKRQENEFDCNIAVSGARGNGKSTFLFKLFSRFDKFDPWKHQVYSRDDVIKLLEEQTKGIIFDDEAIASSYKREFQNKNQQKLIKMLNMYRDNYNVYGIAIPNFYSLDKDIRSMIKIHIQIVARGLGVVHFSNTNQLYQDDPWSVNYNRKIEEKWDKMRQKNPEYSPPYYRLSTFVGYVHFGDLGKEQKKLYKKIKRTKRKLLYDKEIASKEEKEKDPHEFILENIKKGLYRNSEDLKVACITMGLDYKKTRDKLSILVKKKNPHLKLGDLFLYKEIKREENSTNIKSNRSPVIKKQLTKTSIPDIPI